MNNLILWVLLTLFGGIEKPTEVTVIDIPDDRIEVYYGDNQLMEFYNRDSAILFILTLENK